MADKNKPFTEGISLSDGGLVLATTETGDKSIGSWYMTAGMFAANLDDGLKTGPFEEKNDLIELISKRRQDRQETMQSRGFTSAAPDPSELEGEEREEALAAQRSEEAGDARPDGRPERTASTPSTADVDAAHAEAELEGNTDAQNATLVDTEKPDDSKASSGSKTEEPKKGSSSPKSSKKK